MAIFRIKCENSQGESFTEDYEAQNESEARAKFKLDWSDKIINVTNLTMEENARKVAVMIGKLYENSSNPQVKEIAMLAKPIASVSTVLISQYKHLLEGDEIDNVSTIARRIFDHIVSSYSR